MFWRKSPDAILDDMLDRCTDRVTLCFDGVYRRRHSGVLREVVTQLRADGMSPTEILTLVALIIDLITEIGAAVGDIVARIREMKKG